MNEIIRDKLTDIKSLADDAIALLADGPGAGDGPGGDTGDGPSDGDSGSGDGPGAGDGPGQGDGPGGDGPGSGDGPTGDGDAGSGDGPSGGDGPADPPSDGGGTEGDTGGDTGGGTGPQTPPVVGSNVVTSAGELQAAIRAAKVANKATDIQIAGHIPYSAMSGLMGPAQVRVFPKDASAKFGGSFLTTAENISFHGLDFAHKNDVVPKQAGKPTKDFAILRADPNTRNIDVEDCTLFGRSDAKPNGKTGGGYYSWSKAEWLAQATTGLQLRGPDSNIRDCTAYGLYFPFILEGKGGSLEGSKAWGIAGDGMRFIIGGDHVVMNNQLCDFVKIDSNHDDGGQSWSVGAGKGDYLKAVISGNKVLEWVGPAGHALTSRIQGINGFDGTYTDLLIEDNLIICSAYHGITWSGLRNSTIRRNVVLARNKVMNKQNPWIRTGGNGNYITDNVAAKVVPGGATVSNNVQPNYTNPAAPNYFDVDALLAAA